MYCEICCCLHVNYIVYKHIVYIEPSMPRYVRNFRYTPTRVFEIFGRLGVCCLQTCHWKFEHGSNVVSTRSKLGVRTC